MSDNLPVAYASNNVNATANLARGSMNLTESKALDNGYKFVWEFTPSQGNGTIVAAALTSAQGGENAYGSIVNDSSTFLQLKSIQLDNLSMAKQLVLFETVEVDFENNRLYSITFQDTGVRIRTVQIPIFSVGLNDKMDDSTYLVCWTTRWFRPVPLSFLEVTLYMGSFWMAGTGIGMVFLMKGIPPVELRWYG